MHVQDHPDAVLVGEIQGALEQGDLCLIQFATELGLHPLPEEGEADEADPLGAVAAEVILGGIEVVGTFHAR